MDLIPHWILMLAILAVNQVYTHKDGGAMDQLKSYPTMDLLPYWILMLDILAVHQVYIGRASN